MQDLEAKHAQQMKQKDAEIQRLRSALDECIDDFHIIASAGYHEAMIEEANIAAGRVREVLQKGSVTDADQ